MATAGRNKIIIPKKNLPAEGLKAAAVGVQGATQGLLIRQEQQNKDRQFDEAQRQFDDQLRFQKEKLDVLVKEGHLDRSQRDRFKEITEGGLNERLGMQIGSAEGMQTQRIDADVERQRRQITSSEKVAFGQISQADVANRRSTGVARANALDNLRQRRVEAADQRARLNLPNALETASRVKAQYAGAGDFNALSEVEQFAAARALMIEEHGMERVSGTAGMSSFTQPEVSNLLLENLERLRGADTALKQQDMRTIDLFKQEQEARAAAHGAAQATRAASDLPLPKSQRQILRDTAPSMESLQSLLVQTPDQQTGWDMAAGRTSYDFDALADALSRERAEKIRFIDNRINIVGGQMARDIRVQNPIDPTNELRRLRAGMATDIDKMVLDATRGLHSDYYEWVFSRQMQLLDATIYVRPIKPLGLKLTPKQDRDLHNIRTVGDLVAGEAPAAGPLGAE